VHFLIAQTDDPKLSHTGSPQQWQSGRRFVLFWDRGCQRQGPVPLATPNWEDLDLERGELRVERAIYRGSMTTPKTTGSKRTLPLPEAAVVALKQQRSRILKSGPNYLVFPSRKGTPFSDTNLLLRDLKPAGEKIGTLARLAYPAPNTRHASADGRRFKRCAGPAGARADHNHARHLHPASSRTPAGSGRTAFRIGDEW